MREIITKVYQFDELSDEAKEKARDWYRNASASDSYPLDEIVDSVKALFGAAHIALRDYTLGAYSQGCFVKFDMEESVAELTGKRAFAWLENNLFSDLRMTREEFKEKQKEYMSYGDGYRIGKIKPCPLTGMCYDEDLLDALRKSIKSGDNLKDAFRSLADVVRHIVEAEYEYRNEDEQIDETIRANEYEFTIDGKRS